MAVIKVLGVKRLQSKFESMKSLPKLQSTMGKAVALVDGEAKSIVPVDTGFLRSSIHGSVDTAFTEVIGKVATSTEYAPYIEFGTSKMGAQPFMYPALAKNKARIRALFADAMSSAGRGK